jgi:hypothetical protein
MVHEEFQRDRPMSKTVYVEFRERGFWAFDVVSGVFLKFLIDVAATQHDLADQPWLAVAIKDWRIHAVVSDFALCFDSEWSERQMRIVTELANIACAELSKRDSISASEIESWEMIDDFRIFPRGLPGLATVWPIRFGRAVIELLNGSLPDPPKGTSWYFGIEDSPTTLPRRD